MSLEALSSHTNMQDGDYHVLRPAADSRSPRSTAQERLYEVKFVSSLSLKISCSKPREFVLTLGASRTAVSHTAVRL